MADHPWVVVLAGGDGQRLAAVTRDPGGRAIPKQYWPVGEEGPMVRWALERARGITPASRVLVVVNQSHRPYWEPLLADVFRHHVLVQPCNRGTAVGVAVALLAIATRDDPDASVVLLPSDHYVADEERLRQAVTTALGAVAANGRAVHLLGITPDAADADYGWLVPSCRDVIADVARFVEKPPLDAIRPLIADGALINSFVLVARVDAFLQVIGRAVPRLLSALRACFGEQAGEQDLAQAYGALPVTDLSRDVLERRPQDLRVVRVAPCGWSDLGTPARIQPFLVGHHSAA